jgi:excisionase family DNA binding protein
MSNCLISACGPSEYTPCGIALVRPITGLEKARACRPEGSTPGGPGCLPLDPAAVVVILGEALLQLRSLLARLENRLALQDQEYLSIDQAAAVLGVDGKHIRRAIKAGRLPCSNISNGSRKPMYRIARRDLEEWVRGRRVNTAPPQSERELLVQKYLGPGRIRRKCRSSS